MKKFFLVLLAIALVSNSFLLSDAQAAKKKPVITSTKQEFDPATGLHRLKGNVYVAMANYIVTAEEATVDLAKLHVWAQGNVRFQQDEFVFSGDSVYVLVGQSLAQISGNLKFVRPELSIKADYAEYNWSTKTATITGNVVVSKASGEKESYKSVKYNVLENSFLEKQEL